MKTALNIDTLKGKHAGDTKSLHHNPGPGFLSAFSFRDEITSCPERLDLDRRALTEFPHLDGFDRLRLLNLQHNNISKMQPLKHLQNLVILDLYGNQIFDMCGLSSLKSLRVLLLGNNRIQRICDMDGLGKLDALDLRNNQISEIENLSALSCLRSLNLSGNRIRRVDNLQGLNSLIELDLRNNTISLVTDVENLPRLQRLFLSHNSISSVCALASLCGCLSLLELCVDGNPFALESCYRHTVLQSCNTHLQLLDMKRVTEEERRTASASARKEEEKKKESHKQAAHKERRRLAVLNASQIWAGLKPNLDLPVLSATKEEGSPEISPAHSPALTNGNALETSPEEPRRLSPAAGESKQRSVRPSSPRDSSLSLLRLQETPGPGVQTLSLSEHHLAELEGSTLRLFGPGALDALDRSWGVQTAASVSTIIFTFMHFDCIATVFLRIRLKFPNLTHLVFEQTGLTQLSQLASLAQIRRLDQLTLDPEGNPLLQLTLWRSFLIYRLQSLNLQRVNGTEVTMNDVVASERMFAALGHVAATETPRFRLLLLLEESRKRQLQFALDGRGRGAAVSPEEDLKENSRALFNYSSRNSEDPERTLMLQQYLRALLQSVSDVSMKMEALQKLWPSLFLEMLRESVCEMKDLSAFRRRRLHTITHTP